MSKLAEDHAKFLSEFTAELGQLFEVASSDIDRIAMFVEWFGEKTIAHGYGHGVEDTLKHAESTEDGRGCEVTPKSIPMPKPMAKVVAQRKYNDPEN